MQVNERDAAGKRNGLPCGAGVLFNSRLFSWTFWHPKFKAALILALQLSVMSFAAASDIGLPPGSDPCEADWMNRSRFDTVHSEYEIRVLESAANRGEVDVMLGLGMVQRTENGKWQAPAGYNKAWLEKAASAGSLTAAARLARLQLVEQMKADTPPILTFNSYLRALMRAAEEEGDPLSATELMRYTSTRSGYPRKCSDDLRKKEWCDPDTKLLPTTDARKWAVIAAEGGNPYAQSRLCDWAYDGRPELGQPKDDKEAYKWCLIASNNMCELYGVGRLQSLLREGRGTEKNVEEAKHWENILKQPWRGGYGRSFIYPQRSY